MSHTTKAHARVEPADSQVGHRDGVSRIDATTWNRVLGFTCRAVARISPLRTLPALLALVLLLLVGGHGALAQQSEDQYVLAPGDVVRLDILDDAKDPVDLAIAADGSIQAPLLGAVRISGMKVAAALNELSRRYVDERFFVVPKLAFSVATYRPVFVVGDVRLPGMYAFQLDLSVEKALGLAGGRISMQEIEDPILARARLRGEMEAAEAQIIREALAYARITAELSGRAEIKPDDIPTTAAEFVSGTFADTVTDVELRIAKANTEGFAAQQTVLNEQILEAEQGLKVLNQLRDSVAEIIVLSREDLERVATLLKKGHNTQSNVSTAQRQLADQEVRQLEVLRDLSDARSNIGLLRSRLVELSQAREVNSLIELQEHNVKLAAYISAYRKAEEQLVLISSLTADKLTKSRQTVLDFTIRRNDGANVVNIAADLWSTLVPGDVLVVRIRENAADGTVAILPSP